MKEKLNIANYALSLSMGWEALGHQTCPCSQCDAKAEGLLLWLLHGSEHPEQWERDFPPSCVGNSNGADGEIQAWRLHKEDVVTLVSQ